MPIEDETRRLLRKNLEINRENNELLKKLHRSGVIGNVLRVFYWAIILGVPVFLYYSVILPYISELNEVYVGVTEDVDNLQSTGEKLFAAITAFFENSRFLQ
nr:hypothetical protein [Nanoarchaeota archaeon]